MIFHGNRILFVGAHPDDIELGAGALIHHIHPTCDIMCVTLSDNQKNPQLKNVVQELHDSMKVLGVPADRVVVEKFPTRDFPDHRSGSGVLLANLFPSHTFAQHILSRYQDCSSPCSAEPGS